MDSQMRVVVTIPGVRLKTPNNSGRGHWAEIARRTREHRGLARIYLSQLGGEVKADLLASPRLGVRIVRVGGRKMDIPNILAARKGLIDGLADWLGVDDKSDWYDWRMPTQEPGAEYAVRFELTREG